MSNIILLSLISLGVVTSFSFIYSVKKEFRMVEFSEIEGSDELESKFLDIKDFHSVTSTDQMRVILKQGEYKIEVLAESNLMEFILVENLNAVLRIGRTFESGQQIKQNLPMIVKVTAPTFKSLTGRRQSEILVDGILNIEELIMSFGDQSNFKGTVNSSKIDLVLRQQSNATITGKTKEFDLVLEDQSGLHAKSLDAVIVKVTMDNQTNARVFASESISGYVRGNAGLKVDGDPSENTLEKSKNAEILN